MKARIGILCSLLPAGETLADVGCDHGYLARYALARGGYRKVYATDVSAASLKKTETLLAPLVEEGRCVPVCTDGMLGLPPVDCVAIAGLGGEEIVRILARDGIPPRFLLQPMKNAEKVRAFLAERGAHIQRDFTFKDGGKFYDVIAGEREGGTCYTDYELQFGGENLKRLPPDFVEKVQKEREKLRARLLSPSLKRESREALIRELARWEEVADAVEDAL